MKNLFLLLTILLGAHSAFGQTCIMRLQFNIMPTGGYTLVALDTFGPASTTYLWNTGQTTQSIDILNAGEYCVTTTDHTGCTASDCFNWNITSNCAVEFHVVMDSATGQLFNQATAIPWYEGPFSFVWSNGQVGETIPFVPGESLCLTATSPGGCIADTCVSAEGCTAWVMSNSGGLPLTAFSWQSGAVEYLWSTGETTQEIFPENSGYYCVTISNAAGCSSSNCIWYEKYNFPACGVALTGLQMQDGSTQIEVIPTFSSSPLVAYEWSNGSTNEVLSVNEPGYYCVTATNADGCTSTGCFPVCAIDSAYVIIGVGDSTQNSFPAQVFVIQYDTTQGGILIGIDTLLTDANGQVLLTNLPDGPFLLKAALLPGAALYEDYLPTYCQGNLFWSGARSISNLSTWSWWGSDCALPFYHIDLIPGQNPGGPGFIGGLVSEGANFHGQGNGTESEGDPMPGVNVVLTLTDGTPVAVAVTNANGAYEFPSLAWGTYILTLDIPGLLPVEVTVVIGPNQPSLGNINFKVDGNSIALGTKHFDSGLKIKTTPNPTSDMVFIETSEKTDITIFDAQGRVHLNVFGNGLQTKISIGHLPAGVYYFQVRSGNVIEMVKVIKQ